APMPSSRKAPPTPTSRAPRAESKSRGAGAASSGRASSSEARRRRRFIRDREAKPSGQQDRRAGRLPRLEVHVGPGHLAKGVTLVHVDGDDLAGDEVEELARPGEEILALADVRAQRRPGHVERAAGRESLEVERWNRPARGAE